MSNQIFFIHGMFLNPKSWEPWVDFFEKRDFSCQAPPWPLHEGEPRSLRSRIPDGLGRMKLQDVIDKMAADILPFSRDASPRERPVLIGHSMGGLVAQILAAQGLASMGVCLSSVAPNDLIAADWGLLKNVASITNPLAGHSPYEMTPEGFHDNFCNTMTHAQAVEAYDEYAVHESRQVMRDSLRRVGHIDLGKPHVPLLFISGEKDAIIPPALVKKNAEHYQDRHSVVTCQEFPGRCHFICGQPGWEEVAAFVHSWILQQADAQASAQLDRLSLEGSPDQPPADHPLIRRYRSDEEPPAPSA